MRNSLLCVPVLINTLLLILRFITGLPWSITLEITNAAYRAPIGTICPQIVWITKGAIRQKYINFVCWFTYHWWPIMSSPALLKRKGPAFTAPPRTVRSGYIDSDLYLNLAGSDAPYWSLTPNSSTSYAYSLVFASMLVISSYSDTCYFGLSVCCIASS